jgi:predicted nucleic acid-binding protein
LREPSLTSEAKPVQPAVVLDTNVVLDWLLFNDPSSTRFAAAIADRQVRWVASPAMRGELVEVLQRGLSALRGADPAAVLAAWDAHAEEVAEPPRLPGTVGLHCTDPDDQKFLDLAHITGARWLLSRDRAVLRLARSAAFFGISITVPERWPIVE